MCVCVGGGGGGGGRSKKDMKKKSKNCLGTYMPWVDVLFIFQVIGVAQVINKSKGDEVFTRKDEEVK